MLGKGIVIPFHTSQPSCFAHRERQEILEKKKQISCPCQCLNPRFCSL